MEEPLKGKYKDELSLISRLPIYDKTKREDYISYKMSFGDRSWLDVLTNVNIGINECFYQNIDIITRPDSQNVLVNKFNKLSEDYIPDDLEVITLEFNPDGLMLRHEARLAFEKMCSDAYQEGIYLKAISTYRSYYYQWKIYLKNITPYQSLEEYQQERDKVSARPGHSEHQTGLAVDINDLEQAFEATPEGRWLAENSYQYGFILRYPKGKEEITGYDYEPWHFRYLGNELARSVYFSELTYDEFYIRYIEQPGAYE